MEENVAVDFKRRTILGQSLYPDCTYVLLFCMSELSFSSLVASFKFLHFQLITTERIPNMLITFVSLLKAYQGYLVFSRVIRNVRCSRFEIKTFYARH